MSSRTTMQGSSTQGSFTQGSLQQEPEVHRPCSADAAPDATVAQGVAPGVAQGTGAISGIGATPGAGAAFWRVTTAMACSCLSVFLMNSALFPQFDAVFTYARDVSITFEALVLVALAVVCLWRPSHVRGTALGVSTGALCAIGSALVLGALTWSNAPLLVIGACLAVTGRALASITVLLAAVRLPVPRMLIAMLGGTLVSYVCQLFCGALPSVIGMLMATLVLPLVALVLCWPVMRPLVDEAAASSPVAEVSVVRPTSFLPLTHTLYIFQFVMFVGFGLALRFGEVDGTPSYGPTLVIVSLVLLAVITMARHGDMPFDGLCNVAVLLLLAGFMSVMAGTSLLPRFSNTLLVVGNALYSLLITCTLVTLAGRNRVASLPIFCWANGLAALGTTLGALVGTTVNAWLLAGDQESTSVLVGTVTLAFMAYVLFFLRGFSFRGTIRGVATPEPAPEVTSAVAPPLVEGDQPGSTHGPISTNTPSAHNDLLELACAQIATEHGLTPREAETFAMLARGRNREYIENALQVSRNTVKAHVKHVYTKLDIHSHQELLDLVEDRMGIAGHAM